MDWKIHNKKTCYAGHFSVQKYQISHEKFAGGFTPELTRELVGREDAVAVVPYDPVADRVVLIEQFRMGVMRESNPWIKEIVAGLIDKDEQPEEVAKRETLEEAGCPLQDLIKIVDFYPSPGGFSELIHLYVGKISISQLAQYAGLAAEGEDIKVHTFSLDEISLMLKQGEIRSAVGLVSLQWLLANRDMLRQQWVS